MIMKIYENEKNWIIEDSLNLELVNLISNMINNNLNNLLRLKKGYSTKGTNADQYWLIHQEKSFYFKNSNFEDIKKRYANEIINRLKKSNLLSQKHTNFINLKNKNCWSVIGEENSYHTIHFHNSGLYDGISTVLYLNVPSTNNANESENNLFLVMNSSSINPIYQQKPPIITINPEVGKLLIFPDWINHGTYPQTKGIRQTFNIDYYFVSDNNQYKNINYE